MVLWDLAGQPDYRLIHVLFLDDADVALVVFDPSRRQDSLDAAAFWIKALERARAACVTFLVAARTDRGNTAFTPHEMAAFAAARGVRGGYHETSALRGAGRRRPDDGAPGGDPVGPAVRWSSRRASSPRSRTRRSR